MGRKVQKMTPREIYEYTVRQFKLRCELNFETEGELNRAANIFAVRNTVQEWRRQHAEV